MSFAVSSSLITLAVVISQNDGAVRDAAGFSSLSSSGSHQVQAFTPPLPRHRSSGVRSSSSLDMAHVGIFFGTSTGNTETVADLLKEELGDDIADGPFDVDALEGSVKDNFAKYDALIVGTPTWNTGADTERSGTGWDELYYADSMQELDLEGKPVAVFGLGDQVSYAENYADATGELHDVFENLGCTMFGYTSMEGYEHEDSKAIRGDKFCGLLCDQINQEDLTEERVQNWVEQLQEEGFLEASSSSSTSASNSAASPVVQQDEVEAVLEAHSELLDETIGQHADTGFTPYYNEKTKITMWVSSDGRSCYYTGADSNKSVASP